MELSDINCRYAKIKDFSDYYITEYGDVYSTRKVGAAKTGKLHKLKPKNPGNDSKYLNIILCNDYCKKTMSLHRLVAEYFVEGYFEGAVVNHIDGNNRNNYYKNLEWTTTRDNILKSYKTSGLGAKRNYKIWELYDSNDVLVQTFTSNTDIISYIKNNNLNIAPHQIIKTGKSRGFSLKRFNKAN